MGPQDGVDRAIRAIHILVNTIGRTDIHLALLGFGDCRDELEVLAHTLGLDDYITFPGRANDAMIRDYLSTASIGLGPDPKNALNDVSTMNKTLEYMAFGLPTVSFDLVETRFSAGDASVYVGDDIGEFARAIAELLDDPDRRQRMGALGRRRIETMLSWEHQAPLYVGVYDRLFAGAPPGSR
jgi:glycosyltransferase involved in cell wall biosynthesis